MGKDAVQTTEKNNKVPLSIKIDPAIFEVIRRLAVDDDRSVSNTVERLLRSHPTIEAGMQA